MSQSTEENDEGRPYRCGCFDTATREVCVKESDHDGPHAFASDHRASAPAVLDVPRAAALLNDYAFRYNIPEFHALAAALPALVEAGALLGAGQCATERWQRRVDAWVLECFGDTIRRDRLERADRFAEEALELCQTIPEFTADRAHALVDYVFSRATGEREQEVGGVMVTLAALCNTCGAVDIGACADRELSRITLPEVVAKIRSKQAAKPTGSALPVPAAPALREEDSRE